MVLRTWNDITCVALSYDLYAPPCGRRVGHSLLLYGRISGRILVVVVAKEKEVFVLDIVVGLEVLVRFSVDVVVVVGWNSSYLSLNSWGLRRS